jgi:hypothetical protein
VRAVQSNPPISPQLAEFLESGLSFTVATRDERLGVNATRAWALRVDHDRARVTLFVYQPAAAGILADLEAHPEIAVCVDRPADNRACQLKGHFANSRPAVPAERAEIQRQTDGFLANLETIGIPREMTAGWRFWPSVAIELHVTELYEQTPGPGAGEPLAPGALPAGTVPAEPTP